MDPDEDYSCSSKPYSKVQKYRLRTEKRALQTYIYIYIYRALKIFFIIFFEYEKSIFGPPGGSQEVPGGFRKLRGTGTNHLHQVSLDSHGQ